MADARFEDGADRPLNLGAEGPEDLAVIAALLQDAVGNSADVSWQPLRRRFALLLSRFRWEDVPAAERAGRKYERVRAMLVINDVLRAGGAGIDPADRDLVFCVLDIRFEPAKDGAGQVVIVLAGDGEIRLEVECLSIGLRDVSRPHLARAKTAPRHPQD